MPPSGGEYILRYLSGTEVEQAKRLGFGGYPAFRLDQTEHRQGVLAAFLRRLALQLNEGVIGAVEPVRQHGSNIKHCDRIVREKTSRFGHVKLRGF
jgi:hypothetical protein